MNKHIVKIIPKYYSVIEKLHSQNIFGMTAHLIPTLVLIKICKNRPGVYLIISQIITLITRMLLESIDYRQTYSYIFIYIYIYIHLYHIHLNILSTIMLKKGPTFQWKCQIASNNTRNIPGHKLIDKPS